MDSIIPFKENWANLSMSTSYRLGDDNILLCLEYIYNDNLTNDDSCIGVNFYINIIFIS